MMNWMRRNARLLILLAAPSDALLVFLSFLGLRPIIERARRPGSASPDAPDARQAAPSLLSVPFIEETGTSARVEQTISQIPAPRPFSVAQGFAEKNLSAMASIQI